MTPSGRRFHLDSVYERAINRIQHVRMITSVDIQLCMLKLNPALLFVDATFSLANGFITTHVELALDRRLLARELCLVPFTLQGQSVHANQHVTSSPASQL